MLRLSGKIKKLRSQSIKMNRRQFLASIGTGLLTSFASRAGRAIANPSPSITLFLGGDVMTGRGIDQILPHPGAAHLREPYLHSAIEYVKLAERKSGPIPRPAGFSYVWGDALAEWQRLAPDVRIANLETTVTSRGDAALNRAIHYRMHPENVACLTRAGFDCLTLANNHMMDFGSAGLLQTLTILHQAGLKTAGAGRNAKEAKAPAKFNVAGKGRVLMFAWALASSGVEADLRAGKERPGVNYLPDLSQATVEIIARQVHALRRPHDIVVASIHWGPNWGFSVFRDERAFAHALIDAANVDVVHGHSSHNVKGIEVYRDRPILYGCGDLLNDYEGIGGHEEFRADLSLMYFPTLDPATGRLERLVMIPIQIRQFRIVRAPQDGVRWLADTLNREGRVLGTRVAVDADGTLRLVWR